MVIFGRLREQWRRVPDHNGRFLRGHFSHDRTPSQVLGHAVVDALAVVVELHRIQFPHLKSLKSELLDLLLQMIPSTLVAVQLLVELGQAIGRTERK